MKIILRGNINLYYVQTISLLFFPEATFPEDEVITENTPILTVETIEEEDKIQASALLTLQGKQTVGHGNEACPLPTQKEHASKLAVGKAILEAGREFFGNTPPWGILTGVRTSKLAASYLKKGFSPRETAEFLRNEYFVSSQKADLAVEVACNEQRLLSSLRPEHCSLYISIPFCPTRCSYCSFVSYSTPRLLSLIPAYMEALYRDIRKMGEVIKAIGKKVVSIYIGGGTPTILDEKTLEQLLTVLSDSIDMAEVREFTLEAGRPDTITKEKLQRAHDLGVTRISINPQTLNDRVLKSIGRNHTTADFYRAYEDARTVGIDQINTDLIAGLPGEDFQSFSQSVDGILALKPANITVHTFCVKKAADIVSTDSSIYSAFDSDTAKGIDYSQRKAKEFGYFPYYMYRQKKAIGNLENVGFSLPGCEGIYNIYIMEEVHSIFALGAGGVTKLIRESADPKEKIKRLFWPKYPYEYLEDKNGKDIYQEILNFYDSSPHFSH